MCEGDLTVWVHLLLGHRTLFLSAWWVRMLGTGVKVGLSFRDSPDALNAERASRRDFLEQPGCPGDLVSSAAQEESVSRPKIKIT